MSPKSSMEKPESGSRPSREASGGGLPHPPAGGGWTPPPGSGTPPPAGGWQPPSGGGWTPSPGTGWTSPPGGGSQTPPTGGGWEQPPGGPSSGRPGPNRRRMGLTALVAVLALLNLGVGVGVGVGVGRAFVGSHTAAQSPIQRVPQTAPQTTTPNGGSSQTLDVQAIAKKVNPAVVDINTVVTGSNGRTAQAAGTGIILTSS